MKAFALIEQNFWKGQGKILDFSSKNVESVTVTEAGAEISCTPRTNVP
jgi:hypothetical protein